MLMDFLGKWNNEKKKKNTKQFSGIEFIDWVLFYICSIYLTIN